MRIAILSDIHGNLEALEAAMKLISTMRIDEIACCGDIVGYGANPNRCIEFVRSFSKIVVRGNHDAAIVDPSEIDGFTRTAAAAARWTIDQIVPENRKYLATLPFVATAYGCTFVHSSPLNPKRWHYITDPDDSLELTEGFETPLCCIGHTHMPVIFSNGRLVGTIGHEGKYIINPGSVGQPRDGDPRLCFGMLDTEAWTFSHVRGDYNIDAAAEKIINAGLPPSLAYRLYRGI